LRPAPELLPLPSEAPSPVSHLPAFVHLSADFIGVAEAPLRDASLLSGLLIAAASAAGLTAIGSPTIRHLPRDGIAGMLVLEDCYMSVRTVPDRGLLLLDLLAPSAADTRKALDVFARRLPAARIYADQRSRG
jgi:S-adenosylmethionine/arginine decarboxylase-like enzyme